MQNNEIIIICMQNIIFSLKSEKIKLYVLYNSMNAEQLK